MAIKVEVKYQGKDKSVDVEYPYLAVSGLNSTVIYYVYAKNKAIVLDKGNSSLTVGKSEEQDEKYLKLFDGRITLSND